jgi:hypothetical protein
MSKLTESLRHMADDSMGMEPGDRQAFSEAANHIEALETDNKDYSDSFQIRWDADMRAIKMYQKAHPETNGAWPDHADMCVWLMEQLAAAQEAGE